MGKRNLVLVGVPLLLVTAAACGLSLTSGAKPPTGKVLAEKRSQTDLCGTRKAYQELKARVFAEAEGVRGAGASNLDLLSSFTSVRVEEPLLKSRDDELGVTICTGRFVLLLPPGAERGLGGRRYLHANVEYAALPAADGSGLVYQVRGADSIIYRLAAFNLSGDRAGTVAATDLAGFDPAELLPPAPTPLPVVEPFPDPPELLPAAVAVAEDEPQAVVKLASAPALPKAVPARVEKAKAVAEIETKKADSKPPKAPAKEALAANPEKPKAKTAKLAALPAKKDKEKASAPSTTKAEKKKDTAKAALASAKPEAKKGAALAEKESTKKAAAKDKVVKTAKTEKAAKKTPEVIEIAKADKPAANIPAKAKPAAASTKVKTAKVDKATKASKPFDAVKSARLDNAVKAKPQPVTPAANKKPVKKPQPQVAAFAKPAAKCGSSSSERLLCDNPKLAAKKRAAANFQNAALEEADAERRRALNRTRGQFVDYVHRCETESCLEEAYDQRMHEIREIMADTH